MTSFSEIQQPTGMPTAVLRPEGALPAQPDPALEASRPPENIGLTTPAFQKENPEISPFPTPQEMVTLGGTPTEEPSVFTPDDINEFNNLSSANPDQTDRKPVTLQSLARPFPTENMPGRENPSDVRTKITQALAETEAQAKKIATIQEDLRGLNKIMDDPEFRKYVDNNWLALTLPGVEDMMKAMREISPEIHASPSIANLEDYRANRVGNTTTQTVPGNSPTDISNAQ